MIKVDKKNGESGEKLLRRFSSRIKALKMQQKFRGLRYWRQKPTQKKVREAAVMREGYRKQNKRRQFLSQ